MCLCEYMSTISMQKPAETSTGVTSAGLGATGGYEPPGECLKMGPVPLHEQ